MGYPTDDQFREAMENRAPPRPTKTNDVTRDRRIQGIVDKLYQIDFGVAMDGYARARIAQVIAAFVDADREAIAVDMRRIAGVERASARSDYSLAYRADALESAADGVKSRWPMPDVTISQLQSAARPTRDWIA